MILSAPPSKCWAQGAVPPSSAPLTFVTVKVFWYILLPSVCKTCHFTLNLANYFMEQWFLLWQLLFQCSIVIGFALRISVFGLIVGNVFLSFGHLLYFPFFFVFQHISGNVFICKSVWHSDSFKFLRCVVCHYLVIFENPQLLFP